MLNSQPQTVSGLPEKVQKKVSGDYEQEVQKMMEVQKCLASPKYFMTKYAWIIDRNTAKIIKWKPWDYLLNLLDILLTHKEILIPKARQLGVSWLLAGYALWQVLFREGAKVLFISRGEDEAFDLVAKARFILEHLPAFLKLSQKHPDNRGILDFGDTESEIKALPSTKGAGRSTDATIVIRDELAEHPYAKENFASVGPTVDSGGQLIDLSTINQFDAEDHFTVRINQALSGQSNAYLVDLANWRLRPVREEGLSLDEWYETRVKPKYDKEQIDKEYPESLIQALSFPQHICRFDVEALKQMKQNCDSPMRIEYNGWVKIYKEPFAGWQYCIVVDSSEGEDDPMCGGVFNWKTCEKIAGISGKIPIDEQARIVEDLYKRYFKPYIAVERNAYGLVLIEKLKGMKIENWHKTSKEKEGWYTSGANRPVMLADLAEAVRLQQIIEPDEQGINEFLTFIRTSKKPDGEARRGCHDDHVMMWAIFWQIRKSMPTVTLSAYSYKYKGSRQ
jgi:hypothetical protein